jgi:hypothetical protein
MQKHLLEALVAAEKLRLHAVRAQAVLLLATAQVWFDL